MKIAERVKQIVESIGYRDIDALRNYESLVFNTYFIALKDSGKFSEEELRIIKKAFIECRATGIKIEGISRYRRILTGITKGIKGKFYNEFNYRKSLESEKETLVDLGY